MVSSETILDTQNHEFVSWWVDIPFYNKQLKDSTTHPMLTEGILLDKS